MQAARQIEIFIRRPRPHPVQEKIIDNARRFNVVCAGRRGGKTKLGLIRSTPAMLDRRLPIAYFAPTYKMMLKFWRAAVRLYQPAIVESSKQDYWFAVQGGGSFQMWSLDSIDSARGNNYAHAIIDEAAAARNLEYAWTEVIRPMLSDFRGSADFLSTPKGLNYFHSVYGFGDDPALSDWANFRYPTSANPYIPADEIEAARRELPDLVFRQEYLAEFLQGTGAVFRNITACLHSDKDTPADHFEHSLVAGIDWGQVEDFTACSIGCETCKKEVEIDRFNKIDWHFQRERISLLLNKWNVRNALVEINSMGGPNFEELQRAGLPVIGFTTTAASKSELIQSLSLTFEKEEMRFMDEPVALHELEAYEAKRNAITGRIKYNAPEGFHDDTVIARALMDRMRNTGFGVYL